MLKLPLTTGYKPDLQLAVSTALPLTWRWHRITYTHSIRKGKARESYRRKVNQKFKFGDEVLTLYFSSVWLQIMLLFLRADSLG